MLSQWKNGAVLMTEYDNFLANIPVPKTKSLNDFFQVNPIFSYFCSLFFLLVICLWCNSWTRLCNWKFLWNEILTKSFTLALDRKEAISSSLFWLYSVSVSLSVSFIFLEQKKKSNFHHKSNHLNNKVYFLLCLFDQ